MKESFIVRKKYQSQISTFSQEQKADWVDAIFHYQTTGEILENIDPIVKFLISVMKNEWIEDDKKYQDRCEKNKSNGKLGGAKKGNQNARKNWGNDTKQPKQPKTSETSGYDMKGYDMIGNDKIKIKKNLQKEMGEKIKNLSEAVFDSYLDFLLQRERMKVKNTPEAISRHIKLLERQENDAIRIATIDKSINSNRQGLFELKSFEKEEFLTPAKKTKKINTDFSGFTRDLRGRT